MAVLLSPGLRRLIGGNCSLAASAAEAEAEEGLRLFHAYGPATGGPMLCNWNQARNCHCIIFLCIVLFMCLFVYV